MENFSFKVKVFVGLCYEALNGVENFSFKVKVSVGLC